MSTPRSIERKDDFFGRLKSEAIRPPVQAPVPGAGIATKIISARKIARVIGLIACFESRLSHGHSLSVLSD